MLEAVGWAVAVLITWTVLGLPIALALGRHLRTDRPTPPDTTPGDPVRLLREPIQLLGLVRALLVLLSATVVPLTLEQQGAVIAVLAAAFGVAGAFAVSAECAAPLVAGLIEAVLALALAFGAVLDSGTQAAIMSFAAAAIAMYLRTQVGAPVLDATRGQDGVFRTST